MGAPTQAMRRPVLGLRPGDMVVVRSEAEIRSTLDADGRLDGLPVMPEMLRFCGRTLRVSKRADKTCDTVNLTGLRRLRDTVHLAATRCDGSSHGGCQAECQLFWKEAWLARADVTPEDQPTASVTAAGAGTNDGDPPLEPILIQLTRRRTADAPDAGRYFCQATEVPAASTPLPWWEPVQYVRDVRSGNVRTGEMVGGLGRWFLVKFQQKVLKRGAVPFLHGRLTQTPRGTLDLQPGERVRVKSKQEIEQTLDRGNRNCGLPFDSEMLQYCGREFVVRRRVERIIDEPSGQMKELHNDCVMLEGALCDARYHRFCPRQTYPYWREVWLTRVPEPTNEASVPEPAFQPASKVPSPESTGN